MNASAVASMVCLRLRGFDTNSGKYDKIMDGYHGLACEKGDIIVPYFPCGVTAGSDKKSYRLTIRETHFRVSRFISGRWP